MSESWKFFLLLTATSLVVQGFFAMIEMASVSFNKVRLQYYVSKGKTRAIWLSNLLHNPTLLFGTTLIGVNTALVVGSEASRRFYESLGVSPDWAPLTQILIVLIFAEIAPMLAGRRYAEHVAMLGIPLLYPFSILVRPIVWALDLICRGVNLLIGKPVTAGSYLSREELQNMIEEREESISPEPEKKGFNTIVANIFTLKNKTAKDLMQSLNHVPLVPSHSTVGEMRALLKEKHSPYLPIFHRNIENIVAIAYPRDLLRLPDNKKIKEHARPPWFIIETSSILQILKQFRRNNQSLAVVLNEKGQATGILTLDQIVDEIFGCSDEWMSFEEMVPRAYHVVIDRTFEGELRLDEFNRQFHVHLAYEDAETLAELMNKALGHTPVKGESVRIDQFELTVEEASLLGAKMILVRTDY
ncbi:MAG: HlyC/CorC family transporter [Verrucomicrobia bacterium]|nr:HlyC/CorC family transporter [Verrucomicrobiota bacterium]